MIRTKIIITFCAALLVAGCGNKSQEPEVPAEKTAVHRSEKRVPRRAINHHDWMRSINTVAGHDERDTIVGNFTGKGLDTLYVVASERDTSVDYELSVKYYAVSNNPKIPRVELYGYPNVAPRLVFEGDLDGNGTDEWGYLHTWLNSQWRYYRVFTLVNGRWRYLLKSDKLNTPEWFRASGKDIVEPSGKKGYVKINYGTFGPEFEMLDTIEKVTFAKITD